MTGFKKLLQGIIRFRAEERGNVLQQLNRLKDNLHPISVHYSCMDSRVISSRFMQSDYGDHFIVKNAGNLIPHAKTFTQEMPSTEPGALELGCIRSGVKHVVVCGHSDCKAMALLHRLQNEITNMAGTPLEQWVKKYGAESVRKFKTLVPENRFVGPLTFQLESPEKTFRLHVDPLDRFGQVDKLSQVNCAQQLENVASYSFMKEKLAKNQVHLHAFWFCLDTASVYMLCKKTEQFVEVDEDNYTQLASEAEQYF